MMKRLFLAISLPDEERKALSYETDAIEGELPEELNPRASGPDKLHFTIIFLDSQEEEAIPIIVKAMEKTASEMSPFEVKVTKIDYNSGKPEKRMVWAYGEAPQMSVLRDRLSEALIGEGLAFPKFRDELHPHITLVRFEPREEGGLPKLTADLDMKFTAGSVELIESEWPDGDEYHEVASVKFGGPVNRLER